MKFLLVILAIMFLVPSVCQAKPPTNMKGYIKLAQKTYPSKCNNKIKVLWDVRRSDLRKCEISLDKDLYQDSTREWRCINVIFAVAQQIAGNRVPDFPKGCSNKRRR